MVFYNTDKRAFNLIEVAEVYTHSDARAKTNIKDVDGALTTIGKLRPVTYNWKTAASEGVRKAAANESFSYNPDDDTATQYGFLAQEMEEVLPEIVKTSDTGDKLVNYTAIIPLLVQSVQELTQTVSELQQTVEAQALTISQLQGVQDSAFDVPASSNRIVSCSPNPTSGYVVIETELDSSVTEATILITSMAGNREKVLKVKAPEFTTAADISSLPAGIHLVSLYVGGKLTDTCRLIKQ